MATASTSQPRVDSTPLAALTAGDVMVDPSSVRSPDEPVAAAFELLQRSHELRHIVLCDARRHVVGVIDDRRLARVLGRLSWEELAQPLARFMDRAVCRAGTGDSLVQVARRIESSASDAVVVTDAAGRLVGLVTPAEIVRAVAHRLPAREPADE